MRVLVINLKTANLEDDAPLHEIAALVLDTETWLYQPPLVLFPRIEETVQLQIDPASLAYSGVDMTEVTHAQRPTPARCFQCFSTYVETHMDMDQMVWLGHALHFVIPRLVRACQQYNIPWMIPLPIFGKGVEPGQGYLDTCELIGLCETFPQSKKLIDLAESFAFDSVYSQQALSSFCAQAQSLDQYFYQDHTWRTRSALFDVLRICHVYRHIRMRSRFFHPGYGKMMEVPQ